MRDIELYRHLLGLDRPLPAGSAPIGGVRARSFAPAGRLVLGAVQADLAEVEHDDAVIGGEGFLGEGVEDPGGDPFVSPGPQGRVGDLPAEEGFDVDPCAARDQPDEHPLEAEPVRDAGPVTAERMDIEGHGHQLLEDLPDGISHFGVERAHDDGDLHLVVG